MPDHAQPFPGQNPVQASCRFFVKNFRCYVSHTLRVPQKATLFNLKSPPRTDTIATSHPVLPASGPDRSDGQPPPSPDGSKLKSAGRTDGRTDVSAPCSLSALPAMPLRCGRWPKTASK